MEKESGIVGEIDPKGYFKVLAEAIPNVILLIDPVHFKIKYFNHIYPGYKKEDVLNASVFKFILPEHTRLYENVFKEIISNPKGEKKELETSYISKEFGHVWYHVSVSPVLNEEGELSDILLNWKDISSVKLHDIEIHNKEEKLYAIINNTSDVITSIDREYKLTEFNSVFSSLVKRGYGKTNLKGTSVLDYIDPKKHERLKSIYERVFKGEVVNDIEQFDTITGNTVYMESGYNPIYNFEQVVTGISVFSRNISDRVINDQKLKSTLKEREVLLSEIHHRIKNNLALVSSMLQLKETNIDNEAAKEALRDSRKRVKTTALVHEMLYKNDSFDNLKLMECIPELFKNVNVNSNIILDLSGDDYILDLDKALPFGLLLHELMMNSLKHSFKGREQSKLKIKASVNETVLNIQYCDCSGVFPDEVDFNDISTTGLMLIHTFIEQLNGSIQLTERQPPSYTINIPIKK